MKYYTYIKKETAILLLGQLDGSGVKWKNGAEPSKYQPYFEKLSLNSFGWFELTEGMKISQDAKLLSWPEFVSVCKLVGKYKKAVNAINLIDGMIAKIHVSEPNDIYVEVSDMSGRNTISKGSRLP